MKVVAPLLCSFKVNSTKSARINNFAFNNLNVLSNDIVSFGQRNIFEDNKKLFDNYNPQIKDFTSYKIPVHNEKIANYLKHSYSSKEFVELFDYADRNGTFDFNINAKTGYVQTSLIDPKENPLMSKLVWVTDSCNLLPLLKDKCFWNSDFET